MAGVELADVGEVDRGGVGLAEVALNWQRWLR